MEARILEHTASIWISIGREVNFPWKRDTSCPETSTNISSCPTSLNRVTWSSKNQGWWPRDHKWIAYFYWGMTPRAVQTWLLKLEGVVLQWKTCVLSMGVGGGCWEATHQSLLQFTSPSKVIPKVLLFPPLGLATLSHGFRMILTSQCIHFITNKNLLLGYKFPAGHVFP